MRFFFRLLILIILIFIIGFAYKYNFFSIKQRFQAFIQNKNQVNDKLKKVEDKVSNIMSTDLKDVEAIKNEWLLSKYPMHYNIKVTFFWIGEKANVDNKNIANKKSAWDKNWMKHYGGTDAPKDRNEYWPKAFKPKENPFYFALPYNDFDEKGKRKKEVEEVIYWAKEKTFLENESMLKNRWIRIIKDNQVVYAQWEDVGPFLEDDKNYVFGTAEPNNILKSKAGLDVSPAVKDYLNLEDVDYVSWQFVDEKDVPMGPWKEIVTTSEINW